MRITCCMLVTAQCEQVYINARGHKVHKELLDPLALGEQQELMV